MSHKEIKNDNKKLIIGIIVVTLVLILGTSYAFFAFTLKAEKELSVVTGTFKIDYKDQNKIELENAYPMKDAKGMSLTPYEFTIENTGDLKALYDISLEIAENSNLDYNCLKYSIKRNDEEWSSPKRLTSLKLEEGIELDPTGKVSTISNFLEHRWQLAGVASSTTSTSGGKVYRTYNTGTNGSCIPTYTYTYATATYPVQYRAYIRVKM